MTEKTPHSHPDVPSHLIDRENEMAILVKALNLAYEQKGGMVLIRGEAGIGKSRLVEEIVNIALEKGFRMLRSSCMEYRRAPYQPFREMLIDLFGVDLNQSHSENMNKIQSTLMRDVPSLLEQKDMLVDFFYPRDEPLGGYNIPVSDLYRALKFLRKKGYRVIYIGDPGRLASRMVPEEGLEIVGLGDGPKDRLDPRRLQRIARFTQDSLRSFNHSAVILGDMDTLISANSEERVRDLMGICNSISKDNGGLVGYVLTMNISGIGEGTRALSDYLASDDEGTKENTERALEQKPSTSIIDVLSKLFRDMSRSAPRLTIVEDLHWGDKATFNLLQYLGRNINDQRHLIIGTFRDENLLEEEGNSPSQLAEALKRFTREHIFEELSIKRFDRAMVSRMLHDMTGEEPTDEFLDEVMLQTDGNPLFITELLKVRSDLYGSRPIPIEITPRTALSLVERRLSSLDPEDRRILEQAAVLDKQASIDILGLTLGLEVDLLLDVIDRLISLKFLKEGEDIITFEHSKVRESIYDLIDPTDRERMHLACAKVLETSIPHDSPHYPSVLSYHYMRGGDPLRALEYLMKSADNPHRTMSSEELLQSMSTALKGLGERDRDEPLGELRVRALMRIGDLQGALEKFSEAILTYQEALTYCEAIDIEALVMTCNRRLGDLTLGFYKWDMAVDHYMKALQLAQKNEDPIEKSRSFMGLGRMYYLKGDYQRAIECHLLHIENPMRSIGREHLDWIRNLGNIYLEMGDLNQALIYFRLGIKTAEDNDVQEVMPSAYMDMSRVLVKLNEYPEAENFGELSFNLVRDMNLPHLRKEITVLYADLMLEMGNAKEAEAALSDSDVEWEFENRLIEAIYYRVRGMLHSKLRDPDRAAECLMRSIETAESLQVKYELARSLFEFGLIRFQALDMSGAIDNVLRANRIFKEIRSMYYHNRTSSKLRELKFINEGMKQF